MPEKKTPPSRRRTAAKGRDQAAARNGVEPSRGAALEDEAQETLGGEERAGEARQIEPGSPAPAPENGNLHHEAPVHPGVPLAPPGIVPESDVRTHSPSAAMPPREHGFVEELGELPWTYGDG